MPSFENTDRERTFYGLYPVMVTDNQDPENQGRVKIRLPGFSAKDRVPLEIWARLATLMAGNDRGSWFIPEIGDEVVVAFESGDPRRPYVVGALWNGQDAPPEQMDSANNLKSLVSRAGIRLTMDDTAGDEKLILSTPGGHSLVFSDGESSITASDGSGNTIKMDGGGITISAAAKVTVQASLIEVSAGAVRVDAGSSRFNGVVQCDTLIANSIVQTG